MASSDEVAKLPATHLSISPNNQKMEKVAVLEAKKLAKKNKTYLSIVSEDCVSCVDFANHFNGAAKSAGLKLVKEIKINGENPDLSIAAKEIAVTLVLGILQLLGTKKMGNAGNMSPTQSTTVELDSNLDLAFDRCVQALNRLGAKIQSQDKTKFEIKATSRMTWKSWGEELTIRLSDMQNQKVKIEILSSPKLKTTPMDFGKGRENVEKIAKILSR